MHFLWMVVALMSLALPSPAAARETEGGGWPSVVLPEVTSKIRLSNTDVNRLVCHEEIRDVVFSKEKGIEVKISGRDAFIKFTAVKKGEQIVYSEVPSEFHVVCGGEVYTMVAMPQRIPAQTLRLSSGQKKRIEKNLSLFDGLPLEKKILTLIRQIYTEAIPESYTVRPEWRQVDLFQDLWLTAKRNVAVEGEGLAVREYLVSLKTGAKPLRLSEQQFLRKELTKNPLAVALDEPLLEPGAVARLFIVERQQENHDPAWTRNEAGHD